jgi:beta-glucosidase
VIGDFAETPRYQGAGSSMVNSTKLDTLLDSLGETGLGIAGYAKGFLRYGREDEALRRDALKLAASADTVLLCLGLDEISETEGLDRSHLAVNQNQIDLLNDIYGVNTNIVVVFSGGSPVETPWLDKCKAFINGYLGGQAGAAAMADALAGTVNPSGKLAESWPRSLADTPAAAQYPGMEKTAEYREGIFAGYRYYATAKAPTSFPFGFGLSYTTFAYSDLNAGVDGVSFSLSNTGDRAGAEIVQVYVSMGKSAVFRPLRELKGFARVFLRPGERKTVAVPLDDKAFRFFNVKSGKFEIEGGDYTIQIGASSEDIRLEAEIFVEGTMTAAPCKPEDLPAYYAGAVRNVGAEEFEKLLGRPLPQAEWDRSRPLELNDTFAQLVYAKSAVGRLGYALLTGIKNRAEARGKPDLNILYIYYMPFRGLAKMTAGAFNMEMAAAVVEIFNGHFFRGAGRLIKAWLGKNRALKKRSTVS